MSIIAQLPINPNGSRVRYPVKRFSAPFVGGFYDFGAAGNTNTDLLLIKLSPSSVYVMERINFFANVKDSDWLEGMDTEATFPNFVCSFKFNKSTSVWPEPVRCVNYIDNEEQVVFFRTSRRDEQLLITFSGRVKQTAGMVGINPLLAQVNFTIYEVTDSEWVKKFIAGTAT